MKNEKGSSRLRVPLFMVRFRTSILSVSFCAYRSAFCVFFVRLKSH